jgi:cation diffusion facilitator family transporter
MGHGHGHGHHHDTSREGMRALWISLAVLGVTAMAQAVVVVWSGSVALLSDTLHNVADALTAVPVGIAFLLGRRRASARFTYGYGRAEDIAGIVVVLVIAVSALAAAAESVRRLSEPTALRNLPAVAVAAVVGFVGNEVAARVRIRTGRRIGSAVLVADGMHARADALTSLAVLLSVAGSAFGLRWVDPVVGLAIAAMIAVVTYSAARQVLARLMDAVDPVFIDQAGTALRGTDGVEAIDRIRMRWVGHDLHAEVELTVGGSMSLRDAHEVAHRAEHCLHHALPRIRSATVHVNPSGAHT